MRILLVVNAPSNWPLRVRGVEVVAARQYLTDPQYNAIRHARVFNLCRSFAYQSLGYYVSLLAEARGHRPAPDVVTIQDMRSTAISRVLTDDLDHLVQKTLKGIKGDSFAMSIYFGRTLAKRDRSLGSRLFGLFRNPLMRAHFARKEGEWSMQGIRPITANEIPDSHWDSVLESAEQYFAARNWSGPRARRPRYHMALLVDPDEAQPPSNAKALDRFRRAGRRAGFGVETISRDDFGRIGEFDALFIRTMTVVNQYTFRFARRAEAEGLAVIDDPLSIARCTNKVYLAECLAQHHVPTPQTLVVHRDNVDQVIDTLGLPCVLKQPDGSFSTGVTKAETADELRDKVGRLLADSELAIAQQYLPTDFDWRIGVLDGKPLFACQYKMARSHWQIIGRSSTGRLIEGGVRTFAVEDAPRRVVSTAVRASKLIGNGLYGVDMKQVGGKVYVIEINDNPNIDAGYEDRVLKSELYDRIMQSFVNRIESLRNGK